MHAVSIQTQSITVVDNDPDALKHWSLIRSLIVGAKSLEEFKNLLSGCVPDRAAQILTSELHAFYKETYGSMVLDKEGKSGTINDSKIVFGCASLASMTFSWHFGSLNFTDEDTFSTLQEVIRTREIETKLSELQSLDYGELSCEASEHVILASNCESPLFTKGDVIYEQVLRTSHIPTRYISWMRDSLISGPPKNTHEEINLAKIPFDDVWVLGSPNDLPIALQERCKECQFINDYQALGELIVYGRGLLVLTGGSADALNQLVEVAPSFKRILWAQCPVEKNEVIEVVGLKYLFAHVADCDRSLLLELRGLRDQVLKG